MSEKHLQSIADIARLAGVSKSTVSRALNDSPLIGDDTKERIRTIAKEHNFQINIPARRLSLQRSHTIAFVTHAYHSKECFSLTDLFLLELLGAVSSTLSSYQYDLLMAQVDPHEPDWPSQYLDTGRVDGFVLMTSTRKAYHIKSLVAMNAPFIVWGTPLPNHSYCSVTGDNLAGGRLAAEHLLKIGRKRIGFVGGPEGELEVQKRYEGYALALQESGIGVDPSLVSFGEFTNASGTEQTQKLLKQAPGLDAIFANSDLMAVGAINVLHEQGLSVPEDVAVIGYDNLSIARYNSPPLTTISQNIPLVGKLLAQNLIQNIETGMVTNVTIPAELVVRKSA
jgi:DNA-binding LacI/PurR family transcriptional regulator